jgi:elongation factor P
MVSPSDFRNGLIIEWNGELHEVIEHQQGQAGRGDTFFRTKLKNLKNGAIIDQKFRDKDRFPRARIDRVEMQYLYKDGDQYHFMDTSTYDQIALTQALVGAAAQYVKENTTIFVLKYGERAIGVELPTTVDLRVAQTAPGFRGDTAAGGTKPATLETGAPITVPLFVNEGDLIRVDTRNGAYVVRVT